jgi:hypothetical protein
LFVAPPDENANKSLSNPEPTNYLSRYQEKHDIWCQKWSDLTELLDLRLRRVVILLHYGDATDTGNAESNSGKGRRQ